MGQPNNAATTASAAAAANPWLSNWGNLPACLSIYNGGSGFCWLASA
jgi:hypothetical protein